MGIDAAGSVLPWRPQRHEVFLAEHFVLSVLYVQLRACPAGVYGRAFLTFRQMFSATKKAGAPSFPRLVREGGDFDSLSVATMLGKWRFTASRLPRRFCRAQGVQNPRPFGKLRAGSVAETATRTGRPISVGERLGQPPTYETWLSWYHFTIFVFARQYPVDCGFFLTFTHCMMPITKEVAVSTQSRNVQINATQFGFVTVAVQSTLASRDATPTAAGMKTAIAISIYFLSSLIVSVSHNSSNVSCLRG